MARQAAFYKEKRHFLFALPNKYSEGEMQRPTLTLEQRMRTMKLVTPKSDQQKLDLLEQILIEITSANSRVPQLPETLYQALLDMRQSFAEAFYQLLHARENLHHLSNAFRNQTRDLKYLLRDAFSQVKRRGRKDKFPWHVYQLFGLKRDGTQPPEIRQLMAPIQIAKNVQVAAQQAHSKGFTIFHAQEIEEIALAQQQLAQTDEARVEANNAVSAAYEQMRSQRQALHQQLLKLKLAVRLGSVGKSSAQQRDYFEAMGFTYKASKETANAVETDDGKVVGDAATATHVETTLDKSPAGLSVPVQASLAERFQFTNSAQNKKTFQKSRAHFGLLGRRKRGPQRLRSAKLVRRRSA